MIGEHDIVAIFYMLKSLNSMSGKDQLNSAHV